MVMPTKPIFNKSNQWIANAIRNVGTDEYKRLVPVATQANMLDVFNAITSSRQLRNEFETTLVNKIAVQIVRANSWQNPLAKFKRESLTYGNGIEEIQVGLLTAYAHDDGADYGDDAVWSRETPPIDVSYHTVNRKNTYKVTIPQVSLRGAFLTEGGLSSYSAALMQAAETSDQRDEYLLMRQLFPMYENAGGFFKVQVPDLERQGAPDENDARSALATMRGLSGRLTFLSDQYNAAHMPTAINADDLELFITPEANATLDVYGLAAAFNMDRAEFAARTTMVDDFGIPGAQFILTSRDFFVAADQVTETRSIENPANLTTQHFLHRWSVISASRFVPTILGTKYEGDSITIQPIDTGSVSAITVYDRDDDAVTTVERGSSYRIDANGIATDGETETATVLTVTGANSPRTFATQAGSLYIGPDETSDSITVTQTATDNGTTNSITLTVSGDIVILWPNAQVLPDDDNDGLSEVVPDEPQRDGNQVTIPTARGVQYQVGGTNVTNGTKRTVPVTVTAIARSGYELKSGATASWTFTA